MCIRRQVRRNKEKKEQRKGKKREKEKKWSQTTESTNKSSNAAKFKSKIIQCLPLLMETCQCIENALTRAPTYTIILGMCICVRVLWLCLQKCRGLKVCAIVRAVRLLPAAPQNNSMQNEKKNITHTNKKPLLHIAVYHAKICIFILHKDLFT